MAFSILSRVSDATLLGAFMALFLLVAMLGYDNRPSRTEGDRCGPEHHLKYMPAEIGPELQCERDASAP